VKPKAFQKTFLDDSDRNELSEILTSERLRIAKIQAPPKKTGAAADTDLEEILDHVRASKNWQGAKKSIRNKKALRKLSK
jgi:hypothetical protein